MRFDTRSIAGEVVHVDLDLSTSRLIRISGFSNHRPGIPFDIVDRRIVE